MDWLRQLAISGVEAGWLRQLAISGVEAYDNLL